MNTIRVLVADDRAIVRAGLVALVAAEAGMELVGEGGDTLTVNGCDPDIAVIGDVSARGSDGAGGVARLCQNRPALRVLALAAHERQLRPLLAAGAAGVALDRATLAELALAIRAVAAGGTYLDPALAGDVVDAFVRPGAYGADGIDLSERETEVVRMIALGYSNKEIAARLALSIKTVETYKTRSMEKLGVRGRVEIVRYAAKRGWLAET